MILPVPVKQPSQENSLRFIDLSKYEKFFDDLASAFPRQPKFTLGCAATPTSASRGGIDSALLVHEVGDFIASFVPAIDDFDRLDEQFVIPKETWLKLPGYENYGFAVFQLAVQKGSTHPMAFEYDVATESTFFPTVHIHDGEVHQMEEFDHELFVQHANLDSTTSPSYRDWNVVDEVTGFIRSESQADQYCDIDKSQGILRNDLLIHRQRMRGTLENQDVVYSFRGSPTIPTFNIRKYTPYWPWAVVAAGTAWFFNRRNKIKKLTNISHEKPLADHHR